jgi:hypothetical protein
MARNAESTVYLYSDEKGVVRYVGRGSVGRAQSHAEGTHNEALAGLIASGRYTLEAAECRSPDEAKSMEAVVIDLLSRPGLRAGLYNRRGEDSERRLAPLGVPPGLASRLDVEPADPGVLAREHGGVLFVRLGDGESTDPGDDRGVVDPIHSDPVALADRIRRKWLLGAWVRDWEAHSDSSPRLVAGVAGRGSRRYVIGALYVDRDAWAERETWGASSAVPIIADPSTVSETDLDAADLRGRRLVLEFARPRQEQIRYFNASGQRQPYQSAN